MANKSQAWRDFSDRWLEIWEFYDNSRQLYETQCKQEKSKSKGTEISSIDDKYYTNLRVLSCSCLVQLMTTLEVFLAERFDEALADPKTYAKMFHLTQHHSLATTAQTLPAARRVLFQERSAFQSLKSCADIYEGLLEVKIRDHEMANVLALAEQARHSVIHRDGRPTKQFEEKLAEFLKRNEDRTEVKKYAQTKDTTPKTTVGSFLLLPAAREGGSIWAYATTNARAADFLKFYSVDQNNIRDKLIYEVFQHCVYLVADFVEDKLS